MAEKTKFQYAKSPTGSLSGASFIQQTEDAINDLGGKIVDYSGISEETKRKAEQALSASQTALSTSNNALTQSGQAIETANSAQTQAGTAVTEARAAKESANAAKLDAEAAATEAETARQAAQTANTSAQDAASRAQTSAESAREDAYTARQAATSAQESATRAEANSLLAQSQAASAAANAAALANGVVRYDSSQQLNTSQKSVARTNIGAADASDTYTKAEVDAKVASVYRFKGSVATYEDLPTEDVTTGDVWNVESDGSNYAWTGEVWDKLSETIDLTPYLTKSEAQETYALASDMQSVFDTFSQFNQENGVN